MDVFVLNSIFFWKNILYFKIEKYVWIKNLNYEIISWYICGRAMDKFIIDNKICICWHIHVIQQKGDLIKLQTRTCTFKKGILFIDDVHYRIVLCDLFYEKIIHYVIFENVFSM